jgi:hypothetical protein
VSFFLVGAALSRLPRPDQTIFAGDLQAFWIAFRIVPEPIHSGNEIPRRIGTQMPGNRTILYLIIGALTVAVGVLGYGLYQGKKEPEGLQINLGPNGLKIQNK